MNWKEIDKELEELVQHASDARSYWAESMTQDTCDRLEEANDCLEKLLSHFSQEVET